MSEHEEYVRSRWVNARYDGHRVLATCPYAPNAKWILSGNSNCRFEFSNHLNEAEAWSAAYAFTLEREEQIRQVKVEIEWLKALSAYAEHSLYGPARERILAREQAILAELKKGLRSEPAGKETK